ncbi:uncharacterized protein EAF02_004051 [Botrytis sinoallii]|uniref:uncharacterized protein n=1 Tax=Botrytis sinoallii TaxID=1463999 RepID=UPI001900D7C0|nr:uncharacterized protein EAF02_004051 [Botrytis sinoallii]KAF7885542.1 hypothetical protein EAF02_004051 [Botrytis sinoallii]
MRFSFFSLVFLVSYFAKGDFILPQPTSHITTGFPTQISWSTDPVTGPVSLFLVPAGVQDASTSISAIGTQIPNDGMYQWVPRDTLTTAESYFSILMVDSKNIQTVSGTFLIVGLQSFQPGGELRRRVNSSIKSSDSGKNEGYKKSNSTETKTVKSESKEQPSKSVVLETGLSACSAVVTKTKYLYFGATNVANTKTKSSNGSKSSGTLTPLAFYLDRQSTDISGSSELMSLGSKKSSASNSTSSSKSTYQYSSLKHNYGLNSSSLSSSSEADFKKSHDSQSSSDSSSKKGSGSKHSATNSNSKGNSGSEFSSSRYELKGTKDSSGYESGSKESNEYGHGHGHGHGSISNSNFGHESNSTLEHTSTQTDCTLVTSTTIIYVSSSRNTHTQETETSNIDKTTLIHTNTIISTASESLFSISISTTLASTSTLAASTISLAHISTISTSMVQTTKVPHASETSQISSLATPEPIQSIPLFSVLISIPSLTPITTSPPPVLIPPETTSIASFSGITGITSIQSTTTTKATPSTPPPNPSNTNSLTPPPSLSPQTTSSSEIQTSLPPVTLTTLSSSTTSSAVYNLTIQSATGTALPVFTGGVGLRYAGSREGWVMWVGVGVAGWIL